MQKIIKFLFGLILQFLNQTEKQQHLNFYVQEGILMIKMSFTTQMVVQDLLELKVQIILLDIKKELSLD